MVPSDLKELAAENIRLKPLLAEAELEKDAPLVVVSPRQASRRPDGLRRVTTR